MTSLTWGALMVVLTTLAGWWPSRALGPPGASLLGRIALGLALGAAVTGLVAVGLSFAGVVPSPMVVTGLAALSVGLSLGGVGGTAAGEDRAGGTDGRLVGLIVAVALAGAVVVSVGLPFRADGSKFWAPKARELARVPALEAPALMDAEAFGFHRRYPLLVPALLAPVFGPAPEGSAGPKLVLASLTVALGALLLARAGPRARWPVAAFVTMPFLTSPDVRESVGAGGFVDGAAALFLLVLVDAVDGLRRGEEGGRAAGRAVLAAGAMLSTKFEGSVELAIVLGAWFLVGPRRGLVPVVALGGVVLAGPSLALHLLAEASPPIADPILLLDVPRLVARSVPVLSGLGGLLVDASCFGLVPLALVWLAWRGRGHPSARFAILLALGLAAFLAVVYLSTSMHVGRHLYTSAHRLTFHWLAALTLLAARAWAASDDGASHQAPGSDDGSSPPRSPRTWDAWGGGRR